MAVENLTGLDLVQVLSALPGMSTIIRLGQVAIIVVIVYIAFLIIRSIMQIRYAFSMKKLIESVEQINQKMDRLINKTQRKK
jgi:hypothetical protein